MTCPYHDDTEPTGSDGTNDGDGGGRSRGVDRRSFLQSALAIGGASALATTERLVGVTASAAAKRPTPGYGERENRQHAWDAYERYDESKGTSVPPGRHLLLHLEYQGEGAPTAADRRTVARAFDELEELAGWGSDGLLFTVGYSAEYFDRFDEALPAGLDPDGEFAKPGLLRAEQLIEFPGVTLPREDPVADTYDCAVHLASSDVSRVLAAELLLWGGTADVDGDGEEESLEHTLTGVLETPAADASGRPESPPYRRVGFAGHDNLESEGGEEREDGVYPDAIPEDADLSMGFNDLFRNSVPREDNVTLLEDQRLVEAKDPGPFAQGTVQHVSRLDLDLDPESGWYQYDAEGRIERMFSPEHDPERMGEVGEDLGRSNAPANGDVTTPMRDLDGEDIAERTQTDAEEAGVVGHVQKTARARFDMETRITEEGQARLSGGDRGELLPAEERSDDLRGHEGDQEAEQVVLRRDFDTVDGDRPGLHFVALMRFNPYMAYMRAAMNGVEFDTAAGATGFGLDGEARIDHESVDLDPSDDGIVGFTETKRRGNYLVPPLTMRALPHPRAEAVDITVDRTGANYRVTVDGVTADDLAEGTVRFGWFYDVNRARGARPRQHRPGDDRTTFVFPADETGVESAPGGPDGDVRVRFVAKRAADQRPVRGTATLADPDGSGGSD